MEKALHERSAKIALDYLAGSGRLRDRQTASNFIGKYIAYQMEPYQMERGIRSQLLLSKKAIAAYQRHEDKAPPLLLVDVE